MGRSECILITCSIPLQPSVYSNVFIFRLVHVAGAWLLSSQTEDVLALCVLHVHLVHLAAVVLLCHVLELFALVCVCNIDCIVWYLLECLICARISSILCII